MSKKSYQEYLLSATWQKKRKMALDHYGRECVLCGSNKNLEVHHRHYKSGWGNEKVEDLIVLCRNHHGIFEMIKKGSLGYTDISILDILKRVILESPQMLIEHHFNNILLILSVLGIKKNIKKEFIALWTKIMSKLSELENE